MWQLQSKPVVYGLNLDLVEQAPQLFMFILYELVGVSQNLKYLCNKMLVLNPLFSH